MRFSLISLAFFSVFFTLVAALPALETRAPPKTVPARRLKVTSKEHGLTPKGSSPRQAEQYKKDASLKAAPKQPVAACAWRPPTKRPRDLDFDYFDRRNSVDEKELQYDIDSKKITGGSFGDIYAVIGHPNLLAKAINVKPGVGKTSTPKDLWDESQNLKKVGQLEDWGYKMVGASCNKVYYIIMKKVSGTPFPKTMAYAATKGNQAERKALVDKVILLVANKVLEYGQNDGVLHGDLNGSNVMCIENHGQIEAVDLVDWADAAEVDRKKFTHAMALEDAKIGLERMYRV